MLDAINNCTFATNIRYMELRLREILKERKMTIAQFSELSGITQANISNYMQGRISPTLDTLSKIADALHIEVTELFKKKNDVVFMAKYDDKIIEIKKDDIIEMIKNKNITK